MEKISTININNVDRDYEMVLCKVNGTELFDIAGHYVESVNRSLGDIDKISLSVPNVLPTFLDYEIKDTPNPLYDLLKEERFVRVNDREIFVIKEIEKDDSESLIYKNVVCYSREHKLTKITIEFEDMGMQLVGNGDGESVFNIFHYMKEQTGWSAGYIDEDIAYYNGEPTLRWQDSVSTSWYSFLTEVLTESFNCIVTFDTLNKLVNIYAIDKVGEELNLYLSHDNYIKSLKNSSSTNDMVTRLKLVGNEEMDIVGSTVTGSQYIEDFSYFVDNGEMSDELIVAMNKFESMTAQRQETWKKISEERNEKERILMEKQNQLFMLWEEIRILKAQKEIYRNEGDKENENLIWLQISEKEDERVVLEVEVKQLEESVELLKNTIREINILCQRPTATDEDGKLIYNETLLDELSEFVYYDVYSNECFLLAEDLIKAGERELGLKCKPTDSYSIDSTDFLSRLEDNKFRQQFEGRLSLGDVVILYDREEDKEVLLFFVGYSHSPKDKSLSIELSTKKINDSNVRVISDLLKQAKETSRMLNSKKYLLMKQKYNKL